MKELFSYKLTTKESKEITEILENGDKVIKQIVIDTPVKVIIKEPSRQDVNAAKDVFQREWSRCIRDGIVSRAIIDKSYSNSGGFLSEDEKKSLENAAAKMVEVRDKYKELDAIKDKSESDKAKIEELLNEFSAAQSEFDQLEAVTESLYRNSAENISSEKQVLYNTLFLSYIEKDGKLVPLVEGSDIDNRLNRLDAILEDDSTDAAKEKARLYSQAFLRNGYFINALSRGKIDASQLPLINERIESGEIVI